MTDFLLVAWVSALIEITRFGWMLGLGRRWTPGEKLNLLFAGYNGNRNTGSDLRVQETLRQIRHVLGAQNVDFSVMTQNFEGASPSSATARELSNTVFQSRYGQKTFSSEAP